MLGIFFFGRGAHSEMQWGYSWLYTNEYLLVVLRVTCEMPEIEPRSDAYKASTLPDVLSLLGMSFLPLVGVIAGRIVFSEMLSSQTSKRGPTFSQNLA